MCSLQGGEGNGTPLQYSCLENPMDGGAWWAIVHGVAKSRTRLSDFTFTFHAHALEKEMATHSSILAWRIPGMGAWWAAVCGVAQSRTWLTWLSSSSSLQGSLNVWNLKWHHFVPVNSTGSHTVYFSHVYTGVVRVFSNSRRQGVSLPSPRKLPVTSGERWHGWKDASVILDSNPFHHFFGNPRFERDSPCGNWTSSLFPREEYEGQL